MREVIVPGFTTDTTPDHYPAVCAFGLANSGATRLGTTMPREDGVTAFLSLDMNSKGTIDEHIRKYPELKNKVIVNTDPFITDAEEIHRVMTMGSSDEKVKEQAAEKAKSDYTRAVDRVRESLLNLVRSEAVTNIVIDRASQLYNWILFARHGRTQSIRPLDRTVPNQDMINIINLVRAKKNLLLLHHASSIYVNDKETGRYKPVGMGNTEGFVIATVELKSENQLGELAKPIPGETQEAWRHRVLKLKYRVSVYRSKGNTLLEGTDLHNLTPAAELVLQTEAEEGEYEGPGVSGEDIRWNNLMIVLGVK